MSQVGNLFEPIDSLCRNFISAFDSALLLNPVLNPEEYFVDTTYTFFDEHIQCHQCTPDLHPASMNVTHLGQRIQTL